MINIRNQTKVWMLTSIAFGLILMIRSFSACLEYLRFISMWLLLFEILAFVITDETYNRVLLNMLFIITAFGIAAQCLMNQESLLASTVKFRLISYATSLIAGVAAGGLLQLLNKRVSERSAEILWFVLHNTVLLLICMFGTWEYGTLKHVVFLGKPVQVTVFAKLTSMMFMAVVMDDKTLTESMKICLTAGFTFLNAAWFIYMRELGTFLIIALLHLVMIVRFIRPVCTLKKKYLLFWGLGMVAGVLFITVVIPSIGINSAFLEKLHVRLTGVFDPSLLDPNGAGYSVNAARKAVLIGGAFGSSLSLHIPEANTDLAFSYIFLRFGIVISLLIMLLYCGFLSAMLISSSKKKTVTETVSYGAAMVLLIQAFYNIAMCLGVLPICGINLTFISAGTMDLLVGFIMTFLVINSKERRKLHV